MAYPTKPVKLSELNASIKPTLIQISKFLDVDRFNHYRPANVLAAKGLGIDFFDSTSIDNFEKVFTEINRLFNFNTSLQ